MPERSDSWSWPNRAADTPYKEITPAELWELDAEAEAAGLFKTSGLVWRLAWHGQPLLTHFDPPSDRMARGLRECQVAWETGSGDRRLVAHAWHRHMEYIPQWAALAPVIWYDDWLNGDRDAAGPLMYQSFVSSFEAEKWLFNWLMRGRIWTLKLWTDQDGGRVVLPSPATEMLDPVTDMKVGFEYCVGLMTAGRTKFRPAGIDVGQVVTVDGMRRWPGALEWREARIGLDMGFRGLGELERLVRFYESALADRCSFSRSDSRVMAGMRLGRRVAKSLINSFDGVFRMRLRKFSAVLEQQAEASDAADKAAYSRRTDEA